MDTRLFYLLNQAQGQLYKASDRELQSKAGITVSQGAVLLSLEKNDGCSLSSLKQLLKINKSSMGALIERMESANLITKKSHHKDARVTTVFISNKGKKKLDKVKPLLAFQNSLLNDGFSQKELDIVHRFLNSIINKTSN